MRITSEKEYCDRCGAEIPSCRYRVLRYIPLRPRIGLIKCFAHPDRWSEEKISQWTGSEEHYEILCMDCAKSFADWWDEKKQERKEFYNNLKY